MKSELLERLLDAGFTKDEIISLARDRPEEPKAEPEPEEPAAEAEAPAVTEEHEAQTEKEAAAPVETETDKRLTLIEQNISKLLKAVQTSNVKRDSFGSVPESLEAETDKIMQSIIRPEQKERNDLKWQ